MTTIKQIFLKKKGGLNIPPSLLEKLGVSEGTPLKVELEDSLIKIYPEKLTKKAIEKKAVVYALENLGDAVGIGDIKFLKKEKIWKVPIKIYTGDAVGDIYFTADGHFISEKSNTEEDMLKRAEETVNVNKSDPIQTTDKEDNLEDVLLQEIEEIKIKKDIVLKKDGVLRGHVVFPDGTELPKGLILTKGITIPEGSIVKINKALKKQEIDASKSKKATAGHIGDDSWVFGGDYLKVAPSIGIIGVGSAGCNITKRIASTGIDCAKLYAINTEVSDMKQLGGNVKKGLIGVNMTKGLGAGGDYEKGRKTASGDRDNIAKMIKGTNLLFIVAGMGGGTGTGAAPIVAEVAKGFENCTTIAVVTFPFDHEGEHRAASARKGIAEMKKHADTVVILDNNRLEKLCGTRSDALQKADEIITTAITSIAETVSTPQDSVNEINLDYADIRTIMKGKGRGRNVAVMCLGQGRSIEEAVENTITKPLLDVNYEGATSALIHVIGGPNMKLTDTTEIGKILIVALEFAPDANIIWGIRVKEDMGDKIEVIAIYKGIKSPQILGDERTEMKEIPNIEFQDLEFDYSKLIPR